MRAGRPRSQENAFSHRSHRRYKMFTSVAPVTWSVVTWSLVTCHLPLGPWPTPLSLALAPLLPCPWSLVPCHLLPCPLPLGPCPAPLSLSPLSLGSLPLVTSRGARTAPTPAKSPPPSRADAFRAASRRAHPP